MSKLRRTLRLAMWSAALCALSAQVACEQHTCDGACEQIYGESGCQLNPINPSTQSREDALDDCKSSCSDALYSTVDPSDENSGAGIGGQSLDNEADAIDFIRCVRDQDYSSAKFNDTCRDLDFSCPRIVW